MNEDKEYLSDDPFGWFSGGEDAIDSAIDYVLKHVSEAKCYLEDSLDEMEQNEVLAGKEYDSKREELRKIIESLENFFIN